MYKRQAEEQAAKAALEKEHLAESPGAVGQQDMLSAEKDADVIF